MPRTLTLFRLLLAAVLLVTLAACDSNDDKPSLDGIYELDSSEGDVWFIGIQGSRLTSYDYFGDNFDDQGDCYSIFSETGQRSDNEIRLDDFSVRLDGDVVVTDFFGSQRWKRSGRRVSSFTPDCDASSISSAKR